MTTPSHPDTATSYHERVFSGINKATELRPRQSTPIRRKSLAHDAAHDQNTYVILSIGGVWYDEKGPPFAD